MGFLQRITVSLVAVLLISVCLAAALIFVTLAIYFGFETIMAPHWAALATAGSIVLVALFISLVAWIVNGAIKRRRPSLTATAFGEVAGASLRDFVTKNSISSIAALFVVGFAVGVSPKLRRLLSDLFL